MLRLSIIIKQSQAGAYTFAFASICDGMVIANWLDHYKAILPVDKKESRRRPIFNELSVWIIDWSKHIRRYIFARSLTTRHDIHLACADIHTNYYVQGEVVGLVRQLVVFSVINTWLLQIDYRFSNFLLHLPTSSISLKRKTEKETQSSGIQQQLSKANTLIRPLIPIEWRKRSNSHYWCCAQSIKEAQSLTMDQYPLPWLDTKLILHNGIFHLCISK